MGLHSIILSSEKPDTYDHRVWKTGLPVRSAVLKPHAGELVVGWVTTSESSLLYVFLFALYVLFSNVRLQPGIIMMGDGRIYILYYMGYGKASSGADHRRPLFGPIIFLFGIKANLHLGNDRSSQSTNR